MFALTERLLLRPGWAEDAAELTAAIAHWDVVRHLGRAPWPYAMEDAEAFLAGMSSGRNAANFLICRRDTQATPPIIGAIGYGPYEGRPCELGYWITPSAWGQGYATEAGAAVLRLLSAMGVAQVTAGHFADNPASGKVLAKLGFRVTGTSKRDCRSRGTQVDSVDMVLDLAVADCADQCRTPRLAA